MEDHARSNYINYGIGFLMVVVAALIGHFNGGFWWWVGSAGIIGVVLVLRGHFPATVTLARIAVGIVVLLVAGALFGVGWYAGHKMPEIAKKEPPIPPNTQPATQPPPKPSPEPHKKAERPAFHKATGESPVAEKTSPPAAPSGVSSQNGPATGSVTVQTGGAASFGQQGGVTAGTYVSSAPPDRHLSEEQTKKLNDLADLLPESANDWFSVECVTDDESHTLAGEIYAVFEAKQRVIKGPVQWLINPNPQARGVIVFVPSDTDEHFRFAENLANTLNRTGMLVGFYGAKDIKPGIVKVVIFRNAMPQSQQTAK